MNFYGVMDIAHEMASITRALICGVLLVLATHCQDCDRRALDDPSFAKLPPSQQIAAFRRASETHCAMEGGVITILMRIASHGQASVDAVMPYLDVESGGFDRKDAISVLMLTAEDGTDISRAVPALKRIAQSGRDDAQRQLAVSALESQHRHHPELKE